MAGANGSRSPKAKKRKLQEQAQVRKLSDEKKKRFSQFAPRRDAGDSIRSPAS